VADEESVEIAIEAVRRAHRPLLMIGAAGNRKPYAGAALRAFVEETGIPFFTTQMGKGVIDESHSSWLGNATLSEGDFVHAAIERADCIISVGHDVFEKPPFIMNRGQQVVIHVNFLAAQVDPVYFPQIEVIGDIAKSMSQLTAGLPSQKARWDCGWVATVRSRLDEQLLEGRSDARFPLHPLRLLADLREAMPMDGIVCLDNGMYKMWFARHYRAHGPNTLLLDNALATMGAGLPSAIAGKLLHPERSVVAVCGDGGFMMNSQELETAVRLKVDLTVLVLRDDAFGMIRWKQEASKLVDFGTSVGNPSLVDYAKSYGAFGHRVTSTRSLLPLLRECIASQGVHLIDVPIDYAIKPEFSG
jgi:acetolactate synthase-1/2/3 large subunit